MINKEEFLKNLRKLGMSSEDACIVFDLIQRGKDELWEKMEEVSKRAPGHLRNIIFAFLLDALTNSDLSKEAVQLTHIALRDLAVYYRIQENLERYISGDGAQRKG